MAKRKSSPGGGKSGETGGQAVGSQPAAAEPAAHYVVLARKYRPQTFADLIGQEAMVRTLRNAFATGRIAQAYMLTGVRGVGKTTTARILARAFNYSRPGSDQGPTMELGEPGEHCQAIMEGRHPDVLEIDAASNTGVDNVREIIDNVRYRPVAARMKVFIIDEVHMLSKQAFNALLKTLEEPPEHVKFVFATTEIRKVPVTVLSRCQRFDLRRVDAAVLAAHFKAIAEKERVEVESEALALIARAAEGSVRDGLSILDQAFATGAGKVTADLVRSMLGLADRGRILDLLEAVLAGDAKGALERMQALHADGADPVQVLADLAEAIHGLTRVKVAGEAGAPDGLAREERQRIGALAARLTIGLLSRAWQMLVKGLEEAGRAPDARAAVEMVLIRMAHVSSLPSPDDVLRRLATPEAATGAAVLPGPARTGQVQGSNPPLNRAEPQQPPPDGRSAGRTEPANEPPLESFEDLVDFVGRKRDALLKIELEERVSLVAFEPGRLDIHLLEGADSGLAAQLAQKLQAWTGRRWVVALSREPGRQPIGAARREREAQELEAIRRLPRVEQLLARFPGAEITDVRPLAPDEGEDSAAGGEPQ